MKKITLLLLMLVGVLYGKTWIRDYSWGGVCPYPYSYADAEVYNVIPAIGGGYLLQGYAEFMGGDILVYRANVIWKIDERGDVTWQRDVPWYYPFVSIVSNNIDRYYCVTSSGDSSKLLEFDEDMNLLYSSEQYYPSIQVFDMQYTPDGLVFGARIGSGGVVIKTDFNFNLIWQSALFPNNTYGFTSLEPYGDGWVSIITDDLTIFNASGDTLWTYLGPPPSPLLSDISVAQDGMVFALGVGLSGNLLWIYDVINESGSCLMDSLALWGGPWQHQSIDMLPNGNIITLCMSTMSDILHCYDQAGNHLWTRSYFLNSYKSYGLGSKNLLITPTGDIVFCLWDPGSQIYLIKTDSMGNVVANDDPHYLTDGACTVTAYPNPAVNSLHVKYSIKENISTASLDIFNTRGQKVYSQNLVEKTNEIEIMPGSDIKASGSGIYLGRIMNNQHVLKTFKFVIIK
jgi:hypothetical protein